MILLPNTNEREVCEILQRVKSSILEYSLKEHYAAPLSISLGSATVNQSSFHQEALQTADRIMYGHKKSRRPGKACSSSASMEEIVTNQNWPILTTSPFPKRDSLLRC